MPRLHQARLANRSTKAQPRVAQPRCCVAFGDLVGSRRLGSRRAHVQDHIRRTCMDLNQQYHADLLAPFEVREGDAVRVVLGNPAVLPSIFWTFHERLRTANLRWAVGFGTLATFQAFPDDADGPAYYAARDALREAEGQPQPGVAFRGFDLHIDPLLTASTLLLATLRARWKERHWNAVGSLRNGVKARALAAQLHVTEQAIGQQRRTAAAEQYVLGESALRKSLSAYDVRSDWELS